MKQNWEKISYMILLWLSFAVALTVLCGLVYAAVQQDMRQGANDPQIQMAEDAALALAEGAIPSSVVPASTPIDIATSLAPYTIIFDDTGKPIASSARLNGAIPSPPAGVFSYTKEFGEDRLTWQPEKFVRQAIVVIRYDGAQSGFVLSGRSLREVEIREAKLELQVGAAWVFGLFITLVTTLIFTYRKEIADVISRSGRT